MTYLDLSPPAIVKDDSNIAYLGEGLTKDEI